MPTPQELVAAETSGDGFRVSPMGPVPDTVITAATRALLGQVERTRENATEEVSQRELLARGQRHARLFKMSDREDAKAYAEVMTKVSAGHAMIQEHVDLPSGTDFARFLDWVEFTQPVERVQADIAELGKKFLNSVKAQRSAVPDVPETKEVKPKRRRRAKGSPEIDLDAMPPTFSPRVPKGGPGA